MLKNAFEGWHVVVLVVVVLLVFGANRLPGVAKSLGQSMKVFKREVKDLREDPAPTVVPTAGAPVVHPTTTPVNPVTNAHGAGTSGAQPPVVRLEDDAPAGTTTPQA